MKKKLGIKDIANQLNISKTTVSFILNGKAKEYGITPDLESKVLNYVKNVGYIPNKIAQGFRAGKTKILGMMIEDISDPFFSSIARATEEHAYNKGYQIIYGSTENDTRKAKDLILAFKNHGVDGFIIAPAPGIESDVSELLEDGFPIVIFDRPLGNINADTVLVNNFFASFSGVKHLVQEGYQNIALITLVSEQFQMIERQNGYLKAITDLKQSPIIKKIRYHSQREQSIVEIENFLKDNSAIDALYFSTNYIAENGLEAIRNLGLRIPQDVAVIVFDDSRLFKLHSPPVTAISQPITAIASHLVALMLTILTRTNDDGSSPETVILDAELIIRASSQAR